MFNSLPPSSFKGTFLLSILMLTSVSMLVLSGCEENPPSNSLDASSTQAKEADTIATHVTAASTNENEEEVKHENSDEIPFLKDWEISKSDLNRYFPGMLDTVQNRMVAIASRFRQDPWPTIHLSMLRNVGTDEQMFLCTHDTTLKLIDVHYIGKARQMDGTSETIEFQFKDPQTMELEHTEWKENQESVAHTSRRKYTLHITEKGEIVKR